MKKSFLIIVGCLLSTAAVANSNTSVTLDQSAIFNKNGFSRVIEFQIAPETTSFIIQATGKRGSSIAIKAVQDPAGHYITGESFSLSEAPKISALTNSQNPQNISYVDGFSSMLVPNNGAVAVIPGKWKLQAMCYSEPADCTKNPVRVLIMSKTYRGEVKSANATVPVRLRFTGARGWYAQNALQHPTFSAVLTLLNEKMRMAGLNLKIVGLSDAPASPSLKSFEESLEFVRGEFSNKVPVNENAINITFATGTQAFPANAISFGLPGPISTSGRDGFGIIQIVEYGDIEHDKQIYESAESMSRVLLHEIGHYLGLFHVCERSENFQSFTKGSNPLTDTRCEASNLMYPASTNSLLTAQQLSVIRLHPLVQLNP